MPRPSPPHACDPGPARVCAATAVTAAAEANKKIIRELDGITPLRALVKVDDDRIRQQAHRALVNLGEDDASAAAR